MMTMNRLLAMLLAAAIGLIVGGAIGALASQVPVFHWELVPLA